MLILYTNIILYFQVSVERSFSGLKFIVSDLRASLDPDVLEAIMIIRCNEQFKNNC